MLTFDHLAVSAPDLDAGAAYVHAQTGHAMGAGGVHAAMSTHNLLSGMGAGEYLEVIAIDPGARPPGRPRWFDLDRRTGPPRLSNWIARVDDLDAAIAANPDAGEAVPFERGPYRWRMAVPRDGVLPFDGCFPALIEWETAAPTFPDSGLAMTSLVLSHPDGALAGRIAALTDDPRIEVRVRAPGLTAMLDTPDGPRRLT